MDDDTPGESPGGVPPLPGGLSTEDDDSPRLRTLYDHGCRPATAKYVNAIVTSMFGPSWDAGTCLQAGPNSTLQLWGQAISEPNNVSQQLELSTRSPGSPVLDTEAIQISNSKNTIGDQVIKSEVPVSWMILRDSLGLSRLGRPFMPMEHGGKDWPLMN